MESVKLWSRVVLKGNPRRIGTVISVYGREIIVEFDVEYFMKHEALKDTQVMEADAWDEYRGWLWMMEWGYPSVWAKPTP
jgi:hypothetical protein